MCWLIDKLTFSVVDQTAPSLDFLVVTVVCSLIAAYVSSVECIDRALVSIQPQCIHRFGSVKWSSQCSTNIKWSTWLIRYVTMWGSRVLVLYCRGNESSLGLAFRTSWTINLIIYLNQSFFQKSFSWNLYQTIFWSNYLVFSQKYLLRTFLISLAICAHIIVKKLKNFYQLNFDYDLKLKFQLRA